MALEGRSLAYGENCNKGHKKSRRSDFKVSNVSKNHTRISTGPLKTALGALRNIKGSTVKEIADYLYNAGYKNASKFQVALTVARAERDGDVVKCASVHRYKTRTPSKTRVTKKHKKPKTQKKDSVYKGKRKSDSFEKKRDWLKRTINGFDFQEMMQEVTAPSPMSLVRVNGEMIPALIDTGAVLSMMSPEAYELVADKCPLLNSRDAPILSKINPRAANNSPIPIRGLLVADVKIGHNRVPDAFIVVMKQSRPPPSFIVGMNIIRHLQRASSVKSKGVL